MPESTTTYPQRSETLLLAHAGISPRLFNFLKRIQNLERGCSYGITIWLPVDNESEPVWSIKDLGRIENDNNA